MWNPDFPVTLSKDTDRCVLVSFADVPEAHTFGADESEALLRAADALETALEFYTEDGKDLPRASEPKRGQRVVRPAALACTKLAIYQAMRDEGIKKSELAHDSQLDRMAPTTDPVQPVA